VAMMKDIEMARNKLRVDRDSGKLTRSEYEAEMVTLNRWLRAVQGTTQGTR